MIPYQLRVFLLIGVFVLASHPSPSLNLYSDAVDSIPAVWIRPAVTFIYTAAAIIFLYLLYRLITCRSRQRQELQVLRHRTRQIDELIQYKLRFFTNISHEIKIPLTLIIPSAEKLHTSPNLRPEEIQRHSRAIIKNCERLTALLDELMEFRRVEAQKLRLNLNKTELVSYLHAIYEEFLPLTRSKNQQYTFRCESSSFHGRIDRGVVGKILRNLIANAIKYTPGGGSICVSVAFVTSCRSGLLPLVKARDELLQLTISDTGIGIPRKDLRHVFDRFYRRSTFRDSSYGSGIGLDLVRALVKLHRGQVSLKSRPGKGTSFAVTIPVTKNIPKHEHAEVPESAFDLQKKQSPVPITTSVSRPTKPLVLVLEDDREITAMIFDELKEEYQLEIFHDGNKALSRAQTSPQPNLILSDIMMPDMDGLTFCATLKSQHRTSHIPLVFLTARCSTEDIIEGLRALADDYISKPFSIKLLKAKMEGLLHNQLILKSYLEKEQLMAPSLVGSESFDKKLIKTCINAIENHIGNSEFNVELLAKEVGMSRTQLFRRLKTLTDKGPMELISHVRLKRAVELLRSNCHSVSEISYMCGFSSPSSFSTTFKKHYGTSPRQFAEKRIS